MQGYLIMIRMTRMTEVTMQDRLRITVTARVERRGDDLFLCLPVEEAARIGIKEGDDITIRAASDSGIEIENRGSLDDWFARIRDIRRKIPADYRFKRSDAYPANRGGSDDDC